MPQGPTIPTGPSAPEVVQQPPPLSMTAQGPNANANPAMPQGPPMGRFNQQQLIERYRAAAEQIKALEVQIKTLREQEAAAGAGGGGGGGMGDGNGGGGNSAMLESLIREYQGKREMQVKFGQALSVLSKTQKEMQAKQAAAAQAVQAQGGLLVLFCLAGLGWLLGFFFSRTGG